MVKKSLSSLLFKQALRSILSLWKQFLAIVAIGAIAVTLFVGLQANAESLKNRVDYFYAQGNIADSFVTVNPAKGDQGDEKAIRDIVGERADVESRFYSFAKLNANNAYCAIASTFPTISKPSEIIESNGSEDYFFVDSLLTTGEENKKKLSIGEPANIEFDLSAYVGDLQLTDTEKMLVKLGLKPGVQFEDTPLNTGIISLDIPVTGIMNHPENILRSTYSVSLFLLSSNAFKTAVRSYMGKFFTDAFLNVVISKISELGLGWDYDKPDAFPVPNQFLVKAKGDANIDELNNKIESHFSSKTEDDKNLLMIQKKEETSFGSVMENDVTQARQLTYVFPFVFFIVGILVILTTMGQMILKDRINIGTLKAMGVGKKKIQTYYGVITSSVVGLGILIGEILGPIIIPSILDNKYHILYNLPKLSYLFPVLPGILTAVIFLFLAIVVTFLTCRKETSLLPVQSMRPAVQNYAKKTRKSNKKQKNYKLFGAKMAFRNVLVDPLKSAMVIIGVMGCTALLCCGFGIDDTINHGIADDPLIANSSSLALTCTGEIKMDKILNDLKENTSVIQNGIEGVTKAESTVRHGNKEMSSSIHIYSPIVSGCVEIQNTYLDFSWDINKVLLTKKVAERIGAKQGDTIKFSLRTMTYSAQVDVIRDIFYSNGVYIYSSSPILKGSEPNGYTTYLLDYPKEANLDTLKEEIKSNLKYVAVAQTANDQMVSLHDVLSSVSSMTQAIKIFAILLAIVVLYNISLLNFRQRSRDIATMKVLGFNRIEMADSLLFETLSLTLAGVVLGLAAGWPFLYLVLYINQVEVISYAYFVAPLSYFLSFLLTFIVSALINIYLANRTKKIQMVESLKSVE